ncbi:MAG TPA: universal stress protein [Propionicimonas sp.]|jgi:nucleotide-binding universal stress UspA family protein|uniref:universal stress protein n=1 Tax=Propionicimonas sp. TaxID=1955623 RepID=UPI002F429F31
MSESEPDQVAERPRVLVGVDGSKDGLRAVRYALRVAESTGTDLWVVNVVDELAPMSGMWDVVLAPEILHRAGEAAVAEALSLVAAEGFPAERVTGEVLVGRPGDLLAELSGRARLLVVGRRSAGGLERMFVGSTSLSAAMHAACPVIVISASSTPQDTGDRGVVAVAVSTRPIHESALEWGVREAVERGARLRVVHVVPETLGVEGAGFVAAATAGLEEHVAPLRQRHPEVGVEVEVLLGDPVDALVAESRAVDLLILGVHHHAVLGGSIRGVMAHSHSPVGLIR